MGKKTNAEYLIMKDYIIVTGGVGFIGSNLIEFFIKKTKLTI